jgi:membrane fusion protein, multidrug efflux system
MAPDKEVDEPDFSHHKGDRYERRNVRQDGCCARAAAGFGPDREARMSRATVIGGCRMGPEGGAVARAWAAGVAVALALAGCHSAQKPGAGGQPARVQPQVTVMTVHREPVPWTTELTGRTSAYLTAQVRARVDGIVLSRNFKEGDDVTAGMKLYQIDPAPYQATLDSALASLLKAQANLASTTAQAQRYAVLVASNAVSQQDYDDAVAAQKQAEADVASAKASIDTARINLGYTRVESPIIGRIGISQVTPGAYVQASAATLLATVQQIDPVIVDLNQSSVEGLQLRRDAASGKLKLSGPDQAKITLLLEDGTRYPQDGKLQLTDITVDQSTGTVTVRAIFPNPKHVLLPGMFVRARIDEGVNESAMLLPEVSVTHDPRGNATVLVVGSDGTVASRTIQASRTFGDRWVVDGGLTEGDRVIVAGLQRAQPGAQVSATEAPAPGVQIASRAPAEGAPAQTQPAAAR